jgi:hypothetical protein
VRLNLRRRNSSGDVNIAESGETFLKDAWIVTNRKREINPSGQKIRNRVFDCGSLAIRREEVRKVFDCCGP